MYGTETETQGLAQDSDDDTASNGSGGYYFDAVETREALNASTASGPEEFELQELANPQSLSNSDSGDQSRPDLRPRGRSFKWSLATSIGVAVAGLTMSLVFGVGAWLGMNYANSYARKSYQLDLYGVCHDYEVCAIPAFAYRVWVADPPSSRMQKTRLSARMSFPAALTALTR